MTGVAAAPKQPAAAATQLHLQSGRTSWFAHRLLVWCWSSSRLVCRRFRRFFTALRLSQSLNRCYELREKDNIFLSLLEATTSASCTYPFHPYFIFTNIIFMPALCRFQRRERNVSQWMSWRWLIMAFLGGCWRCFCRRKNRTWIRVIVMMIIIFQAFRLQQHIYSFVLKALLWNVRLNEAFFQPSFIVAWKLHSSCFLVQSNLVITKQQGKAKVQYSGLRLKNQG